MTSFNLRETLERTGTERPTVVGLLSGAHAVGVIRVAPADGFWERHDAGEELLVVLDGRMAITLRGDEGERTHEIGPGDAVLIPRGVSHCSKVHGSEVRLLFVSPVDGNAAWTEGAGAVLRHGS